MELEQQVVSLELAKKLKELGFKQESLFYYGYACCKKHTPELDLHMPEYDEMGYSKEFSAYTTTELGKMLKEKWRGGLLEFKSSLHTINIGIDYIEIKYDSHIDKVIKEPDEANLRAKCLIYLKENNLI